MQNILVEKLNSISKVYGGQRFSVNNCEEKSNSVSFYTENQFEIALRAAAPYLKIALFSCKTTFLKSGRQVIEKIKGANNKVVSYIVPDDFMFSVSSACGAFNLAEDVRAVVVLDTKLFELASYFATIRGIDVIYLAEFDVRAFESNINVINGDNIDKFKIITNRHVVLRSVDYAFVYAQLASILFSLIERFYKDDNQRKIININRIKRVLNEADEIEKLILLVEICCDNLVNGGYFEDGFLYCAQRLLGQPIIGEKALYAIRYLLKCLNGSRQAFFTPDYNALAQSIHKFSAENYNLVVKKINEHIKFINENASEFNEYSKYIIEEAKRLEIDFAEYQKRCFEKSGRKIVLDKRDKFAIKNAGAFNINAATVLRERS